MDEKRIKLSVSRIVKKYAKGKSDSSRITTLVDDEYTLFLWIFCSILFFRYFGNEQNR